MHKSVQILSLTSLILIIAGMNLHMRSSQPLKAAKEAEARIEQKLCEAETGQDQSSFLSMLSQTNPDFRAFLEFESGLIRLPVVQGSDNARYLDHLFDGSEGITGTLFFDMQCERDDSVRIIYGHTVFTEGCDLMFTPLHSLCSQHLYEENRYFALVYPDETERFEIIAVFVNDEDSPDALDTRIRSFASESERDAFLHEICSRSVIQAGRTAQADAELVILQTCMDEESGARLCVLAASVSES